MIVVIAGATGTLGQFVAAACLHTPFRGSFTEVRILTRNPSSPVIQELQRAGAIVKQVDFGKDLEEALKDATIVVDVLGGSEDGHRNQDALLEAVSRLDSVKYYVPSDFGVDTRSINFEHPEWSRKIHRAKKARGLGTFRVISIFPGLFMEITFGPWLGFDIQNQVFTAIGKADVPFSVTSKADIGLAVASICSLIAKGAGSDIPDYVKLSGETTTFKQAAEVFNKYGTLSKKSEETSEHPNIVKKIVDGLTHHHPHHQEIKVQVIPVEPFKTEALAKPGDQNLLECLRFSISEGYLNNGSDNSNKLVNPNSIWQFTSLEEYAKKFDGRPFCKDAPQDSRTPIEQIKEKIGLPDLIPSNFTADIGQDAQQVAVGSSSLP